MLVGNINKIVETVELSKNIYDGTYTSLTQKEKISNENGFTFFDVLYEVILKNKQSSIPQGNIIKYLREEEKKYNRRRDAIDLLYISSVCDFIGEVGRDKKMTFYKIKEIGFRLLDYERTDERFWNILRNQIYRYAPFVYFIRSLSHSFPIQKELSKVSNITQARKITMRFGLPVTLFSSKSIEWGSEVFLKWGKELNILDEHYQLTDIGYSWIEKEPKQLIPPKIFVWNLGIRRSDTASSISKRPNLNRSFVEKYLKESAILRRTTLIMYLAKNKKIKKENLRNFFKRTFNIRTDELGLVLEGDIDIMKRLLYLKEDEEEISIPGWLTIAESRLKKNIEFYQYEPKAHIIEDYINEANRIIIDFEKYIIKKDKYPAYVPFNRSQFNNSVSGSREFRIGNKLRMIFGSEVRIGKGNLKIPTAPKIIQVYLKDNPDFYHPLKHILFDVKGNIFTKGYGRPDLMNRTLVVYSKDALGFFVFVGDIPKGSQAFEDAYEYERIWAISELFLDNAIEKIGIGEINKKEIYDFLKKNKVLNSNLL